MRPLKLVTRAFGPYARELSLDFKDLGSRTLFLIHGPTGAGKTTILDAMCFALYGVCSGDDRDTKRVRSDLADPALQTEVFFDFRLGGDDYRVHRRPEQPKPKRRGDGATTARAEAVLWRRTGLTSDRDEGVVLANQWKSVTEHVERLLGFRSDQFRQVVMLPQGEFRRLLLADSRQRQEILEVLFQTQLYRRIEEALKQAAKELKQEITETDANLKFVLKEAGVESAAELALQREAVTAEREEKRAALGRMAAIEKDAQEKVIEAKRTVEKIQERHNAETDLHKWEKRVPEFAEKGRILGRARQATAIIGEERTLEERAQEAKQADLKLQQARTRTRKATGEKEAADTRFQEEDGKKQIRDDARKRLDRLDDLTAKVSQLYDASGKLGRAEKELSARTKDLGSVTQARDACTAAIQERQEILAKAEKTSDRIELLALRWQETDKAYGQLKKLGKARKDEATLEKGLAGARDLADRSGKSLEKARAERVALENAWIKGQAAILAARLSPGEPCPVCGSTDHPSLAMSDLPLPDEQTLQTTSREIEDLREQREYARNEAAEWERKVSGIQAEIRLLEEGLGELAKRSLTQIDADRKSVKEQLTIAEDAGRQVKVLKQELQGLEQTRATLAEKWNVADEKRLKAAADRQQAEAIAAERGSGIPDGLKKPGALEKAKKNAEQELGLLEAAFETARMHAVNANEVLTACKTGEKGAEDNAAEAARRLMDQREQFQKSLRHAGFADEHVFRSSKRTAAEIDQLESAIQSFDGSLTAAKERLKRAQENAAGLEPPDMSTLNASAIKAKKDAEQAVREEATLGAKEERLGRLAADCGRLAEKREKLEAVYAVKGRISEVANGSNRDGITFQRFVLAALLDDVLLAASKRLSIMSNGRFRLQRVQERTDRRASGGLDLEVHDTYSGTARPVSTLSGGESFLASLSLALGLADVVQSYSGGIQLDAVFVDEGFGSLDPEALDLALQALIDLQRDGRIVGIISHVPTLREIIDARLEVSAQRSGSSARFVIGCGRDG
jgi:DNA repair protein SbcC/Rad50